MRPHGKEEKRKPFMEKDTIIADARRLTAAAEQAQEWIRRTEARVRA